MLYFQWNVACLKSDGAAEDILDFSGFDGHRVPHVLLAPAMLTGHPKLSSIACGDACGWSIRRQIGDTMPLSDADDVCRHSALACDALHMVGRFEDPARPFTTHTFARKAIHHRGSTREKILVR